MSTDIYGKRIGGIYGKGLGPSNNNKNKTISRLKSFNSEKKVITECKWFYL